MDEKLIQRVTMLAVGVEKYQNMRPLKGPRKDIQNLRHVLVYSPETALYEKTNTLNYLTRHAKHLDKK